MPHTYCFSCGKLRDTQGGLCTQCIKDMRLSKQGHGDKRHKQSDNLFIDLEEDNEQAKPKTRK